MPIYSYACDDCGHRFDMLLAISNDKVPECPACQSKKTVKQLHLIAPTMRQFPSDAEESIPAPSPQPKKHGSCGHHSHNHSHSHSHTSDSGPKTGCNSNYINGLISNYDKTRR